MSLVTQLGTLITRVGTEFKAIRVLISGSGTGNVSGLDTTATNLVDAINEVRDATGGSVYLDDLVDVVNTSPTTGHIIRHNGSNFVNVLGTTHFDAAGAASSAQSASQPLDSDLTSIAALTTTSYGRAFLALSGQTPFTALVANATETATGAVELATTAEAAAGTDVDRAVTAAGVAATFTARIDTTTSLGSSNTLVPSQLAVKTYADALIAANDAMVFKGVIDASANPNYPAANRGDTYKISVAGKIGGGSGPNVEAGDLILCITDSTSAGTHGSVGTAWDIVQVNIDGAVTGPASSTASNFPTFSDTTGKIIQDSGLALDTSTSLASNSDLKIPSQKAVKAYAQPLDTDLTAIAALTSAANKGVYATGSGTWALYDLTAAGLALLDDADASAQRTTLSVYSTTEVGDPTTNFVTTFEAALT